MNRNALIFAVTTVCLASGASAFAQSHDYRNDSNDRYERRDRDERDARNDRNDRDDRDDRYDRDRRYARDDRHERRDYRQDHHRYEHHNRHQYRHAERYTYVPAAQYSYQAPRYDGHRTYLRRGAYLPQEYYGQRYVVNDWRNRRLSAPPHGSHWVHAGNNDFVLVAIATGLIAQVLLNH